MPCHRCGGSIDDKSSAADWSVWGWGAMGVAANEKGRIGCWGGGCGVEGMIVAGVKRVGMVVVASSGGGGRGGWR